MASRNICFFICLTQHQRLVVGVVARQRDELPRLQACLATRNAVFDRVENLVLGRYVSRGNRQDTLAGLVDVNRQG